VWTIAFVTTTPPEGLPEGEYVSVFVPTTPNPTSGYLVTVLKKDTRPVGMTVDQGLKYVISLGMVGGGGNANARKLKAAQTTITAKK
jgi:uncharacterized membrane protein